MKYIVLIIMSLTFMSLSGQVRNFNEIPEDILVNLDKMGIDNTPLLDSCESTYFNVIFKDHLDGFDFTNKKIGFLSSVSEWDKKEYFEEERKRFFENSTTINSTLYIFDTYQKKESGGYDAAIVSWSKFLLPVNKVIKKLKK